MVSAPVLSVSRTAILTLALISGAGLASTEAADRDATREVNSALGKGNFPWYDSAKDQVKPVAIPQEPSEPPTSTNSTRNWSWVRLLGDLATFVGFGLAFAALVGLLFWLWRIYEPINSQDGSESSKGRGEPSRIEALPAGMRREFESSDPWEEAIRRRARGDLAGAVVCLFAHQLLTLSRLGLVRLAPGRTGRQLLRSVVDAEFRSLVQPTLRLFEAVYYGHRTPTVEEFSKVWEQAEAFERRVAAGVVA